MPGMGGRLEIPIYGLMFISVPIGLLLCLVAFVLALAQSRHTAAAAWGLLFYGVGAAAILGSLSLMGFRFTIPP